METGGEEQVQSRGGEKRDRQKEMERERDTERHGERERESLCVARQRPPRIKPQSGVASGGAKFIFES